MISYGKQSISQQDIDTVVDVLKSDFLTQGPVVDKFEQSVAKTCLAQFAIATNSATSALHLACLALNIAEGDIVWTSPISFVASANCARYAGATVDFVDIDSASANISVSALKRKLQQAQQQNKLPKALVVVHMAGLSCEMKEIYQLARKYQVKIIEDASHAIGGEYQSKPIGCCQYSDICIFSFHPVKVIAAGEGGMALTNDVTLAEKMKALRSHGITRETEDFQSNNDDNNQQPWYYQQQALGFNYRMSDMHAALGLSQLSQLKYFVARRNQLAERYQAAFEQLPISCQTQSSDSLSAYHLMLCQLSPKAKLTRNDLFKALRDKGIGCQIHYIPIYRQPYYREMGFNAEDYPAAERYYQSCISIPLFPALEDKNQDYIIKSITDLLT